MKKITFLFSLLLLFFVGGLTASAQNWQEDEKLDYVPDEETPVALFHPGTSGDSPARWWAGTNTQTTDELTNKGLVIFEPTGEDFYDSFLEEDVPTYRLKDYATGKYLKDVRLSDYMDSSDYTGQPVTDWTENENEAFVFTVMPGEEGDNANPRALVNNNKQSTGDGEFVLCSTYTYTFSGETVYTYLGAIAQPFLAPWQDTNAWQIFSVREKKGLEVLEALLQEYFPNGVDESTYAVGPNPGQYNAQIVSQVQGIYNEIAAVVDAGEEIDDETLDAYIASLEEAHRLITEDAFNPMKPGYYYLKATGNQYMREENGSLFYTRNETVPETPSAKASGFIWKVTAAEADNEGTERFYFQNYSTKNYFSNSRQTKSYGNQSYNTYLTTAEPTTPIYVTYQPQDGRFNIKMAKASGLLNTFYGNAAGYIGEWNSVHDAGSLWNIIALNEADVDALAEEVEKAKRNEELLQAWLEGQQLYHFGREITADDEGDQEDIEGADFSTPEGLLTDASQLNCGTNVESSEGSVAGLVDGIIAPSGSFVKDDQGNITIGVANTHYYHTMWSAVPTEEPYIQISLTEPVDAAILKIAKRVNAGNQMSKFMLYTAANADASEWKLEGIYDVNFDKPALGQGLKADKSAFVDSTWQNATALVGVELSMPSSIIKIVPVAVGNQTKGDWGIFNIGELRVYAGMYNEERSTFEQVDADVADEFTEALAEALSELNQADATQATIDRLKAAIEAFRAQLPDPSRLTDAIAAFNNYYNDLPVTSQSPVPVGFFPENISEIKAVVDGIGETVNPLMTRAEIESGINAVAEQLAALKAKISMPYDGQYYIIRGRAGETTYKNVSNAPLYAANNATKDAYMENEDGTVEFNKREATHYMPYKQDGSKADSVNVNNHINYVWLVENVDKTNQTFTLQNVGTGTYFGYIPDGTLSQPVYMSKEPITIQLQSAHVNSEGYFNLIIGEDKENGVLYANGQPQTGNIVKWNSARGTDNSAFEFQLVATLMENTEVALKENVYNVITLPYSITRFYGNGKAYTCLGQKEGNIELKEIANGSAIDAGTPFIYKAAPSQKSLNVYVGRATVRINGMPVTRISYQMEPLTVNGLVGTLEPIRISQFPAYKLTEDGQATVVAENALNQYKEVAANSGYFYMSDEAQTTETGDLQIPISGYDPTGIATLEVATPAKSDRIYDLSGRRVMKAQKGLYIINGQKVLVK